jgi:hypothetical protein
MLPAAEKITLVLEGIGDGRWHSFYRMKITLVLEGIGDDKIRVNSSSLDHPLTILPDQGVEIVGIQRKVMVGRAMRSAYWLNHDPSGLVEAGYGPATK